MTLKHQFSPNEEVQLYIEDMAFWIVENSKVSMDEVEELFLVENSKIQNIFSPYPETALHHDPAKFAEMLAVHWELIEAPKLEFV